MSEFQSSLFGSIYLFIYVLIFIGFCVTICCNPRHSKLLYSKDLKFIIFIVCILTIELLLTLLMIFIAFFIKYDDQRLCILTVIAFYHYIMFTLPFYKTYLLMKYLKWLHWSLLCDFVILQSKRTFHDLLNRLYCCLHHLHHHNTEHVQDEELLEMEHELDTEDENENVNLLHSQHSNKITNHQGHSSSEHGRIHKRNDRQCVQLQSDFMSMDAAQKWTHVMHLVGALQQTQTDTSSCAALDRSYRSKYVHDFNKDPLFYYVCVSYLYWIFSGISLCFPFVWMPMFGEQLYFHAGFYKLCLLIVALEVCIVFSIWYLLHVLRFNCPVLRVLRLLDECDEAMRTFYNDDYFVAFTMHRDMELIHAVRDSIGQIDIASVILSFLLHSSLYGVRPRKNTIY